MFGLFNSRDQNNPKDFEPATQQLKNLETGGININVNETVKTIFSELINIVGDNLGLHQMFALIESFNAKIFCRFCYTKKKKNDVFDEDNCVLRIKESYKKDLILINPRATGINKSCLFNDLSDFHFTENVAVDYVHSILEGIGPCDIGKVLNYFILKKNLYFTLREFNFHLEGFYFSCSDDQNKPLNLSEQILKNTYYFMSDREMMSLIQNLPMIIGHLIPFDSEHWQLILLLQQIVFCLTAKHCQFKCSDF